MHRVSVIQENWSCSRRRRIHNESTEEPLPPFAGDAVTTAPDQLEAPGFSPNTHYPRNYTFLCLSKRAMMPAAVFRAPA